MRKSASDESFGGFLELKSHRAEICNNPAFGVARRRLVQKLRIFLLLLIIVFSLYLFLLMY